MNTIPDERSRYPDEPPVVMTEGDGSIAQAVEIVMDRGQRFITDSARLIRFDMEQMLRAKAMGWSLSAIGLITIGLSWIALMFAAGVWLAEFIPTEASVAGIAGLHVIAGIVLVWRGSIMAKTAPKPSMPRTEAEPEGRDERE